MAATERATCGAGAGALMRRPLSLRQTVQLWGGLHVPRLEGSPVCCKDVTKEVVSVFPELCDGARVACVHINVLGPCLTQMRRGGKARFMRDLLASREALMREGYTHIAVSGPMLEALKVDARMQRVGRFNTHAAFRAIASLGAWVGFLVARLTVLTGGRARGNLATGFPLSLPHIWRGFAAIDLLAIPAATAAFCGQIRERRQ